MRLSYYDPADTDVDADRSPPFDIPHMRLTFSNVPRFNTEDSFPVNLALVLLASVNGSDSQILVRGSQCTG